MDTADAFPLISLSGALDTDGDGRPDTCDDGASDGMVADADDDGDMVPDVDDGYPLISLGTNLDTDMDGRPDKCPSDCMLLGMIADEDDDGDGALDYADPFPLDASTLKGKKAPTEIKLLEAQ